MSTDQTLSIKREFTSTANIHSESGGDLLLLVFLETEYDSLNRIGSCRTAKMSSEVKEDCLGWAARDSSGFPSPYKFPRRFADLFEYGDKPRYRAVGDEQFGHEIAGVVKEVSPNVHRFKVGQHVGVGTYVNSCKECDNCIADREVHCEKGAILTFNSVDVDGTVTKGGYSSYYVVHERYCFRIPDGYPLASAAPLLCAGITVYSPMIRHKMNQPGKSLGVIGLGGLGHLAVKFGKAFGLNVTVFSTSMSKKEEALNLLGSDKFVVSSYEQQMKLLGITHLIIHCPVEDCWHPGLGWRPK
ncbi:unnamed protein product [Ilex paraguariensis]|uniref:Alcohol dehydrogenase-like N-terminal domain-containing protein n=1 Tax=Ilex paraguariensis TaxID=185542 RepID=A0ABC8S9J8_9AQUA